MFGKKKLPVLTETSCAHIDLIRKTAEVLTGKTARLKRYDFNTGRGQLYLDDEVQEFYFQVIDEDRFHFAPMTLCGPNHIYEWNIVHIHEDGTLRIGAEFESNKHERDDGMPMWWVGDSATNRWEAPLYK